MSLINEVLNQLEQRGVHTSPHQTQIRAVATPAEKSWLKYVWIGFGIVSLLAVIYSIRFLGNEPQAEDKPANVPPTQIVMLEETVSSESAMPASKLSYELSASPLPDSLREQSAEKPSVEKPSAEKPIQSNPDRPAATALMRPAHATEKLPEEKQATPPIVSNAPLPLKQVSQAQQADAEFRKAAVLQQQGHVHEALAGYEIALRLNSQHDKARLAFAALLLESKRGGDAERVLQDGLKLRANHVGFSMALARVQVEQGGIDRALATMQKNLSKADDKADYQSFYAALLQRKGRHKEAVNHYQIATDLVPSNGVWWMGYGISLQEAQRNEDARVAFNRALATQTLTPELTAFVEQRLKGL